MTKEFKMSNNKVDGSITHNQYGMTKAQMDRKFKDIISDEARIQVNKHYCWVKQHPYCALCGKVVNIDESVVST